MRRVIVSNTRGFWFNTMPIEGEKIVYIGLDEAGRGPVIGDMVIACIAASRERLNELENLGVTDSKLLSPRERVELYGEAVKRGIPVIVAYIPPWRLDLENLNDLEAKTMTLLLRILAKMLCDYKAAVFIDEVKGRGASLERSTRLLFQDRLVEFRVEPKADKKYTVVSLASIVAKVNRDKALEALKKLVGDFGSGYPSDPKTREWIATSSKSYKTPPLFIRRKWKCLRELALNWTIGESSRIGLKGTQRKILDYRKR